MRGDAPIGLTGLLLGALVVAAVGCGGDDSVQPETPPEVPAEITLDTVASDLETPWAMAFAPDGRIFVTERPGRIRVIDDGGLRPEPWVVVDVVPPEYRSEGGLLGIAVAPDFGATGHIYVVGTFATDGQLINRVLRFTDRDGLGVDPSVIVDGLPAVRAEPGSEPAIHTHVGGAVTFGPDGMLYVTTGDATSPELAQDPASLAGKLLRYQPDGAVPADNPTLGSPIYASGLRNPQALTWHPETGDPFVSEHGPSELSWEGYGGWFGDEVNAIIPTGNYGWPEVAGTGGPDQFIDPLVEWSPSVGPAGLAVYSGPYAPWQGNLMVANLRGERLWRIVLERNEAVETGWQMVTQEPLLETMVGAYPGGGNGAGRLPLHRVEQSGQPREASGRRRPPLPGHSLASVNATTASPPCGSSTPCPPQATVTNWRPST